MLGFKSLGDLGAAKSENDLSALIDNIPSMYNTSYVCLVSVEFVGSAVFTAMGRGSTGGAIQIVGFYINPSYGVQRALSYYGAPVYRQMNAGTWGDWMRYN